MSMENKQTGPRKSSYYSKKTILWCTVKEREYNLSQYNNNLTNKSQTGIPHITSMSKPETEWLWKYTKYNFYIEISFLFPQNHYLIALSVKDFKWLAQAAQETAVYSTERIRLLCNMLLSVKNGVKLFIKMVRWTIFPPRQLRQSKLREYALGMSEASFSDVS